MKRRYRLSYFISQAIKSLWRNGVMSFASIAVLMSCLVVMGGFALLVKNINTNLNNLSDLNEIVAFCDSDIDNSSEEPPEPLTSKILAIEGVKDARFVSKAEARLEMMRKMNIDENNEADRDLIPEDSLSAKYVVTYSSEEYADNIEFELNKMITEEQGIRKVNARTDLARTILKFKTSVQWIFIVFLVILFVVTVFIIINTIKLALHSRRHEISVMRYVGATGWFITLPFIFEGVIIGLAASAIGFLVEMLAYGYIERDVISGLQMIEIIPFSDISLMVFLQFLAVGVVTGIIGSCISLGKYLKS
ncbi:MAG: ABC transporter permease [Clostridia bacterium]|nr:ABC transporter permease [Clostridia bacterium]